MSDKSTLREVIEGLHIIEEFEPKAHISAEHDQIYCGSPDGMPSEPRIQLETLGWFVDSDSGCWSHFV